MSKQAPQPAGERASNASSGGWRQIHRVVFVGTGCFGVGWITSDWPLWLAAVDTAQDALSFESGFQIAGFWMVQ
jgi:hypothetical protein